MSIAKGSVPMENNLPETIPYVVHESEMSRLERTVKRLFILCLVLIIVAVGTNAYWIWYESQWQDEVITQEIRQDSGEGGSNTYSGKIIGGDYYGEADDQNDSTQTDSQE